MSYKLLYLFLPVPLNWIILSCCSSSYILDVVVQMLHIYPLSYPYNIWHIILHISTGFYFTSSLIFVLKTIISNYYKSIQCACYLKIHNISYILVLKYSSIMNSNMAHWFKFCLCHTINFGTSIIVVFLFFSHNFFYLFIYFWYLYITILFFVIFILLIII